MRKLLCWTMAVTVLSGCAPGSLLNPRHSYMQSKREYAKRACAQAQQMGWCYDSCPKKQQPMKCKPQAQISIGVYGSTGATAH